MNMSFRLTDMRVRMDKTHELRERTVRIDPMSMSFRLMDMRVRMDKTHGLRERTVWIDQ